MTPARLSSDQISKGATVTAGPAPGDDIVTRLFSAYLAAEAVVAAAEEQRKEERRADPVLRARRSEAAHAGWATRRAREAAEDAEERARYDDRPFPAGPVCDGMYHDSRGSEMPCMLPPGHDDDCTDN